MRKIGTIEDEKEARVFSDYLLSVGFQNQISDEPGPRVIWIEDEDQVEKAMLELERYRKEPHHPKYLQSGKKAEAIRRKARREEKNWRDKYIDLRTTFTRGPSGIPRVTLILFAVSVAVSLLTRLGHDHNSALFQWLTFTTYHNDGFYIRWKGIDPILSGQIWRLFTPIFLHFSFLHILFNMLWLLELGSSIESKKGPTVFLLLVLLIAGLSNMAQYKVSGPAFGGMSGVVYGLLGYIWMKMKFQPWEQLAVPPRTVAFMVIWLLVCLTGLVGNIANTVHFVGFGIGVLTGYLPSQWPRIRKGWK